MSWQECTLGDLITLKRGHDLPNAKRIEGSIPVVSSSGITGCHNKAKAKPPGVVTGRYGTLGQVFFLEQDYWPLNTALYVIDFKDTDPRFSAYFLKNTLKSYKSDKAAVPGVDRKVLHALKVRAPDRSTQERIVDLLSAYDDLIENNKRRIELLQDSARQLYKEWFVRFRFPGHEHIKIIDGVPEGWMVTTLGDTAVNYDRKRVPLSIMEREKRPGIYPYYGAAGILDYIDGHIFEGRYLLMGEDGTVQTKQGTPLLQLVQGKFWVSNHAHVLEGVAVSTEFLHVALSNYQIAGHITGVAQPKINQKNMNRIPVLVPPKTILTTFDEFIVPTLDQVFVLDSQNLELQKVRDLLLPKLMSGEVAV